MRSPAVLSLGQGRRSMGISRHNGGVEETALASLAFAYVDLGVKHGLARDALMKAAGLDDRLRGDPDAHVPVMAYMILWRELLVGLPSVCVPVEAVRALDPAAMGVAGQIVVRADDIQHAAALSERFSKLTDTAVGMRWIEREDRIGYAITHRPEVVAMRFPIEVMLGAGYRMMCHAAGEHVPLREVTFAHAAGYPVAAYEELFGAPVRFGAADSALWLDRELVTRPLARRDPLTRRYLEAHAEQMLAQLPAQQPPSVPAIVAQIREAVLVELATSGAELARVAKRVAMSTRTVQRRLEESGTSYQEVVDDVRAAMARTLLRDRSRSIIDVAFELGYADLKGFYRAFRRWTGTTPAEFRATTAASGTADI
jgi:AraC-like DNA-binding protein